MMIPNSPGGGYDQTGRAAVAVMEDDDLTGGEFEVHQRHRRQRHGRDAAADERPRAPSDLMMTVGLGVVGAVYSYGVDTKWSDATPLARLIEEHEGVLVPADSPFKTVDDFVEAWKKDPGSVTVGGGSSPGGPDHLFPMQLASAVGIDPKDVTVRRRTTAAAR